MAGNTNLRLITKLRARIFQIIIALPQMNTTRFKSFCKSNIIIHYESNIMFVAYSFQRFGKGCGFIRANILNAELERGHRPCRQSKFQLLRKVSSDIQRRNQI